MIVTVRYHRPQLGGYGGRDYAYDTCLPLAVGDKVIAPTANEPRNRAIVTAVNVPQPAFALKLIEEYDPLADAPEVDA